MFAERLWSRQDSKLRSCSPGRPALVNEFLYSTAKFIPLPFLILLWHVTVGWEVLLQLEEFSVAALTQPLSISVSFSKAAWRNLGRELRPVLQGAAAFQKPQSRWVCAIHSARARTEALFSYVPEEKRSKWSFQFNSELFYVQTFCQLWGKPLSE